MLHPLEGRWQTIRVIHLQFWMDWYIGNVVFKVAKKCVYVLHVDVLSEFFFDVVPTNRLEQALYHTIYIIRHSTCVRDKT